MTDTEFLLADLKENHSQSSWDWPADGRFAEHLGIDTSLIDEAMRSQAPAPLRINISRSWNKITQRRLRGLRKLVKRGDVDAYWMGTGLYGTSDFGINRTRSYSLWNSMT